MALSQKTQYALRAVFELTVHRGEGPIRIADIAQAQAIPVRFLEVILHQLKRAGFVNSKRGKVGGYFLVRDPAGLSVGEILRFVQGSMAPVECLSDGEGAETCELRGKCAFMPLWQRVDAATRGIYDTTTFQDLVDEHAARGHEYVPCYSI